MRTPPYAAASGLRLTLAFDRQLETEGVSRVSENDVVFGYRLLDYAGRTSVSPADYAAPCGKAATHPPIRSYGFMFWLMRKRLSGSYFRLTSTSRL
jgi:hypothetical protein